MAVGGGDQPASANAYVHEAKSIVVIGKQFVAPYPVNLRIVQKVFTLAENNFCITDTKGNLVFKVIGKFVGLQDRRLLLDADGNPLASLKHKVWNMYRKWEVFRGDSNGDLLFSVKRSSLLQFKTALDVFLASNTNKSKPDFKIKGNWLESGCTIYTGDIIIAQMHRQQGMQSLVLNSSDNYGVTTNPNVDYAFIVTLVVILDEINAENSDKNRNINSI